MMILWFAGDMLPQFYQSVGTATQALTIMYDPQDVSRSSKYSTSPSQKR